MVDEETGEIINPPPLLVPALLTHAAWVHLKPFALAKYDLNSRPDNELFEIFLKDLPIEWAQATLDIELPCCACGRPMRPFRVQQNKREESGTELRLCGRDKTKTRRLFVAVACPFVVNPACARGKISRDVHRSLVQDLIGRPPIRVGDTTEDDSDGASKDNEELFLHEASLREDAKRWHEYQRLRTDLVEAALRWRQLNSVASRNVLKAACDVLKQFRTTTTETF